MLWLQEFKSEISIYHSCSNKEVTYTVCIFFHNYFSIHYLRTTSTLTVHCFMLFL